MQTELADTELNEWVQHGKTTEEFAQHPLTPSEEALRWHAKHRKTNGLEAREAVLKTRKGTLLWHEVRALNWYLGR